jgi:DHA2 family lincomycin resistance protein-like MFS transporter
MARNETPAIPKGRDMVLMLAVLMGSNLVAGYSETMMNIALPTVAKTYAIDLTEANWITLSFTIVAATAIITSASVTRKFGLRNAGLIGLGASILGCVLGIFAVDFPLLLVSRALQAVCIGMFFPVATGAILAMAPADKTGSLISLNSLMIGVGTATGPLVSGIMLDTFGIHGVYYIPLAASVIMFVLAWRYLHDIEARSDGSLDPLSCALAFIGLAGFIFGLSRVTKDLPLGVGCMVAGAAVIAVFVHRQIHLKTPLLDLSPLKHPRFSVGIALVIIGMGCNACLSLLTPLYYEGAGGYTSFMAGIIMFVPLLVYSGMSFVGGRIFDRHGFWPVVTIGFCCIAVGLVSVALAADSMNVFLVMALSCIGYFGIGLAYPPTKVTELKPLPRTEDGEGSAINSVAIQLANSFGQALFVGILSANVDLMTARGVAEKTAYAHSFSIAIWVAVGMVAVGIVLSLVYVRMLKKDPATAAIAGYNKRK